MKVRGIVSFLLFFVVLLGFSVHAANPQIISVTDVQFPGIYLNGNGTCNIAPVSGNVSGTICNVGDVVGTAVLGTIEVESDGRDLLSFSAPVYTSGPFQVEIQFYDGAVRRTWWRIPAGAGRVRVTLDVIAELTLNDASAVTPGFPYSFPIVATVVCPIGFLC